MKVARDTNVSKLVSEPVVSYLARELGFETTVLLFSFLMLEDLLGRLPAHIERSAGTGRAHLRIGKLPAGGWTLAYVFNDGEEVIYMEGPSLFHLAEEALCELEERGYG